MAVHSKYISRFIANEIPTGIIDGINKNFELAFIPQSNSVIVRLCGLIQVPGISKDYTLLNSTIIFTKAPKVGQEVAVNYFY